MNPRKSTPLKKSPRAGWPRERTTPRTVAGQTSARTHNQQRLSIEAGKFHVVRHETGHPLGFPHEHTWIQIVDRIDREKGKPYFMSMQGWSRDQVIAQVLTPLDSSALIATANADPNSIMCYWLPASIMKDGVAVAGGADIDATDAQFAASVYPKFANWQLLDNNPATGAMQSKGPAFTQQKARRRESRATQRSLKQSSSGVNLVASCKSCGKTSYTRVKRSRDGRRVRVTDDAAVR